MTASTSADRCRLTIVAPGRSLDLAVPAAIPLTDVLPAIVDLLGDDSRREFAGRGVSLQLLGGGPLDEEQTTTGLGLRDGDVVYLHARDAPAPTFAHDDLIDGVAGAIRERPGRWSLRRTRATLRVTAGLALLVGLAAPLSTRPGGAHVAVAGVMAAVLLLAAGLTSRALGDRVASLVLGAGAVVYAAVGGLALPSLVADGSTPLFAARLAAAAGVAAATSVAVAVVVGGLRPMVAVVVVTGAAVAAGALLAATGALTAVAAASVIVVTVLLLSPVVPSLAFRLSGMRLPDLPTTPEDITRDVEPIPESTLSIRTSIADHYVTAGYLSVGIVAAGGLWLLRHGDWAPVTLSLTVCALLLLRSRLLAGAWQRWALLAAAGWGIVLMVLRAVDAWGPTIRLVALPAVAFAACVGLLAAVRLPDTRRPRPYWGRAAELIETTLAVALVPVLLAILGVYGFVRGLGG